MKNLIGKCKSLIACAIAFAVVAVSLFTGAAFSVSAEDQCGGDGLEAIQPNRTTALATAQLCAFQASAGFMTQ